MRLTKGHAPAGQEGHVLDGISILQQHDVAAAEADILEEPVVQMAQSGDLAATRTYRQGDIEQELRQQGEGIGSPENAHDASA
jgi:hypothetical protein